MPDELLTVFRLCFLALLYLFFFRVLRAIWTEVNSVPEPVADAPTKLSRKAKKAIKNAPSAVPVAVGGPGAAAAAATSAAPTAPPTAVPQAATAPQASTRPRILRVIDPPNLAGLEYALTDGLTFGRGGSSTVVLDDNFMSTHHLRVSEAPQGWFADDLGSTNGTYLNRVRIGGTVELAVGDQLQMGNVILEVSP